MQNLDMKTLGSLPEENGVILVLKGEQPLFTTATVNIRHTVRVLHALKESNAEAEDLFRQAETLEYRSMESGTQALIQHRMLVDKGEPEFNQRIQLWKNYTYLAINPAEFPFVKISEYTDEDWFYIGPFRSRFFLVDLMELLQKLLKIPHCEVKSGPCEKRDEGKCRGWCVLIPSETKNLKDEKKEQSHLQKLDALLKEAYVHADNKLLDLLLQEKDKYENDLEFARADALSDDINLLKRYKEWLVFFYKIKNLNYINAKLSVKGGQLVHFKEDGKDYDSPFINIPYRPNELLALNKNLLDEARILYRESL